MSNYLELFKNLQITKEELQKELGMNLHIIQIDKPITIYPMDIVHVLSAYRDNKISMNRLIDWVNTVWFTDLFEYVEEYSSSIASVMDKLEDLDEEGRFLDESLINRYMDALLKNEEV